MNKFGSPFTYTDEFVIGENSVLFIRTKKQNNQVVYRKEFTLNPISPEEIVMKRYCETPGLVFKHGDLLYHTVIPKNLRFATVSNLGSHLCSECNRMSALPDSKGGCQKVRNKSLSGLDLRGTPNHKAKIVDSKRIEKYDFINMGYESFNTAHDILMVLECKNHEMLEPRPQISLERASFLKESLEKFLYDDYNF